MKQPMYKIQYTDTNEIRIVSQKELLKLANQDRDNFYTKEQYPIKDVFTAFHYLDTRDILVTVL